jgi:hypothetical protein
MEVTILVRCWVPEKRLREFVEAIVRSIGIDRPGGYRPCGVIWLDGDRLEERGWEHITELLALTGADSRTWMGFSWRSPDLIRCELQRDDGYDGIFIRIEVPMVWVALVGQTAAALGGGVAQAELPSASDPASG